MGSKINNVSRETIKGEIKMKICFYRTSGRNFNNFDYEIIEEFNFKNYIVKVIEFKTLNELIEFSNKIGYELILKDSKNVIKKNQKITHSILSIDF